MGSMQETEQERPDLPNWTLGWRLRRSLEHAGLDVQDMADLLEVSRSTLSRWMHDEIPPRRPYLKMWADETKVTVDWLVQDDPKVVGLRPSDRVSAGGGTLTDNKNYTDRPRRRRRKPSTVDQGAGDDQKITGPGSCGRGLAGTSAYNHSYQHFRWVNVEETPQDVEVKQRLSAVALRPLAVYNLMGAPGRQRAHRRRCPNGSRTQ